MWGVPVHVRNITFPKERGAFISSTPLFPPHIILLHLRGGAAAAQHGPRRPGNAIERLEQDSRSCGPNTIALLFHPQNDYAGPSSEWEASLCLTKAIILGLCGWLIILINTVPTHR